MHVRARTVFLLATWWLGVTSFAEGQVTDTTAADSVGRALRGISARVDSLEAGLCPLGPGLALPSPSGDERTDSLAAAVRELDRRLEAIRVSRCAPVAAKPEAADSSDDLAALRAAARAAAGEPAAAPGAAPDTTTPPRTQFVGRQRNASALNPEISATGDIRVLAQEDQRTEGLAREFEFAFQSALDPYSNTKIFVTFEDEELGVEEGYIYWTGLPGRLRVDVGKFREQVGDLNRWHLHALPETEYPLVYQRFLSEEGLTGIGISLYTALPVSLAGGTHEIWA
ncbi:MAG: hypothetical protein ACREMX_12905, partial [Gemmatimonadales bacterium]